jgi:hypothetical protein
MTIPEEMEYTSNRSVFNKCRKWYLESIGDINCARCRYHKGENSAHSQRSWKEHRKTQYKGVICMLE